MPQLDRPHNSQVKRRKEAGQGAAAGASHGEGVAAAPAADLSKDSFLDILRRGTAPPKTDRAAAKPTERGSSSGASFLRDDFMLGKQKAKDWDRDVDADEEDFVEDAHGADVDSD